MERVIKYLLLVSIFVCVSCTQQNIKNLITEEEQSLISSKGWYIRDASTTMYSFEDVDYFADSQILHKAMNYSWALGQAGTCEWEAENYLYSMEPEYRYNPNKLDIVKQRQEEAQKLKEDASKIKDELLELLLTSNLDTSRKGIWVVYTFSYKEYVARNTFNGPFRKTYLYRLSSNGDMVIKKQEVSYGDSLFEDFYQATGHHFTATEIK